MSCYFRGQNGSLEYFCTVADSSLFNLCLRLPSGGLEELAVARRLPKAYSTGFVGCVKDVVVDGGDASKIVANAPRTVDGFFIVPKVVE